MRFPKLYFVFAPLAAALATCGCQSSHHPAPVLSAKQSTPPAIASTAPKSASAEAQTPAAKPVREPATPTSAVAPSADPVADLIAKVEKEYAAGQDNYKAGHLDAARQNFDRAFDLLLGSDIEVNSDPRLES